MPNVIKGGIMLFSYFKVTDITKRVTLALYSSTMVCTRGKYFLRPKIDDETRY